MEEQRDEENSIECLIVAALACAVGAVLVMKREKPEAESAPGQPRCTVGRRPPIATRKPRQTEALPRLVDLGAGKCIPCKMMAPILEELREGVCGDV